jgi:hypothetical protein
MRVDVEDYVRTCPVFQGNAIGTHLPYGRLTPLPRHLSGLDHRTSPIGHKVGCLGRHSDGGGPIQLNGHIHPLPDNSGRSRFRGSLCEPHYSLFHRSLPIAYA